MREKKKRLTGKQKFALKLIGEEVLDPEIQSRMKNKFGEGMTEEDMQRLHAISQHMSKNSPTRYFRTQKGKSWHSGLRRR
ncbi:MAG: hypothetical protein ACTSRK_11740 [Promethearchaeota archaeon]